MEPNYLEALGLPRLTFPDAWLGKARSGNMSVSGPGYD